MLIAVFAALASTAVDDPLNSREIPALSSAAWGGARIALSGGE
jgi:hypothetical protein